MNLLRRIFKNKPKPEVKAASSQVLPTSGEYVTELTGGANLVDGKQSWEVVEDGKNDLETMLKCCEAELATMKRAKVVAAPFYFERAAILLRSDKQYAREIEVCEEYIQAVETHYSAPTLAMRQMSGEALGIWPSNLELGRLAYFRARRKVTPNPRFERTRSIWLRRTIISFWARRSQMKRAAQPER